MKTAATIFTTLLVLLASAAVAVPSQAAAPGWRILGATGPTNLSPTGSGTLAVYASNIGGAATRGTTNLTVGPFPSGIAAGPATGAGWSCQPPDAGSITCTRTASLPPLKTAPLVAVPLTVGPGAVADSSVSVTVDGGGAAPDPLGSNTYQVPIKVSDQNATPGVQAFWAGAFDAEGRPATQAGSHPHSAGSVFLLNTIRQPNGRVVPAGEPKDVIVDLPAGFIGNPLVTAYRCPQHYPAPPKVPDESSECNDDAIVGEAGPMTGEVFPQQPSSGESWLYNNVPPLGYPAAVTFPVILSKQLVVASVRSKSDFGVTVTAPNVVPAYKVFGSSFMLEGSPVAANGKAFLTNPTECSGEELPTLITANAWHLQDVFSPVLSDASPPVTGCELVPFAPDASVAPTAVAPDSPSGVEASIDLPQHQLVDPDAIVTSHLKKTVVELPAGVSVNPSGAPGLEGCSDAQIAFGSDAKPTCPDGSKIGTAEVTSPLVDQPLTGDLYLGEPKSTDPTSGEMFRLFLALENDRYGLLVKLPGSATADPVTGRLVATFDENPRVPFDHLEVKLKGGDRGVLATPLECGQSSTTTTMSPWSGTADVIGSTPWDIAGDCGFDFAPTLKAGMDNRAARGSGTLSFRFARPQGDQTLSGLTATLPSGLLASVKDVPLCQAAEAASGTCPASSRIGIVDASAGSGDPFVLEEKGEVFLTEGYKGGEYGLAVKIRAIAGPFRGQHELSPIIVRQAVHVDRRTAQVSAVSDPFPQIHHGVPLRIRQVTVLVDRDRFMLNPSDCASKQVAAALASAQGSVANLPTPFQATGCANLPFEPGLELALTGRKQVTTGKHPGVKATVTQAGIGEAGIEQAVVRLPKSIALDPNNAQALCEFADGTKPDLENHCPKGSIVGRARAKTPLLKDDLVGNVYFVKNVRTDTATGNQIRTLPMIVVALRGEIAVNLRGESSTTKSGRLVNTFASVPDAPISRFDLSIQGGSNGILAVTRTRKARINLCAGRHVAESDMDGQNGRRHDTDIRMKTPCTKKQTKAAKLRAKRAAAKVKRG